MIAVIRWTLWQRRWSIVWWSIAIFGLIFINMIFYPIFRDQAAELQKSFENLPPAAVQLFGGSTDFFSPVGFLNSQIFFLMLPLLLSVLAIGLGSSLLGREEQELTVEQLLARPLSRSRLLLAYGLAGLCILSLVTLVGLITTVITAIVVDIAVPLPVIVWATLVCFLLVASVGAIVFAVTAIGRTRSAGLGIGVLIAFGGYLISSLAETVSWLRIPANIFPFHYYQSEAILQGAYDWKHIIFFVTVTAGCAVVAWLAFRHRDIG